MKILNILFLIYTIKKQDMKKIRDFAKFESLVDIESKLTKSQASFLTRAISIDQYNASQCPPRIEKILSEISKVLNDNDLT